MEDNKSDKTGAGDVVVVADASAAAVVEPTAEELHIQGLTAKLQKAEEDRDNYKKVALKRLGKLPGDAQFLSEEEENGQLSVAEQVKKALLDKEIADIKRQSDEETRKILRENSELKLALKNRPGSATIGSDSSSSTTVKDNVFSEAQLVELRRRATTLKLDPEKFIESMKNNIARRA